MVHPSVLTWRTVAHGVLVIFSFVLPLWALPWTSEAFELNKQGLLLAATSVIILGWLVSSLLERRVETRIGYLTLPILMWLGVVFLSAVFSQANFSSWLGGFGAEDTSVLTTFCAVALACVIPLLQRTLREGRQLGIALVTSGVFVAGLALFPLFKVNLGIFANTLGTPMSLGIFLVAAMAWASGWWLVVGEHEVKMQVRVLKILTLILCGVAGLVLLIFDNLIIWTLGLFVSTMLLGLGFYYAEYYSSPVRFLPAVWLFTLSFTFLLFSDPFRGIGFQPEVTPLMETAIGIVREVWSDGAFLLGTGPGTFGLSYTRYIPEFVNNTNLWDVVMTRGHGQFLTLLVTHGIFGGLAFLAVIVSLAVAGIRTWFTTPTKEMLAASVPPFMAWLVFAVATFFYPTSMTLVVWFWILSGVLLAQTLPAGKVFSLGQSARAQLVTAAGTLVVIVASAAVGYLFITKYSANVVYAQALDLARTGGDRTNTIFLLSKAVQRWPHDVYLRDFSARLLLEAGDESAQETPDEERFQSLLAAAVDTTSKAVQRSPKDARNWDVRGLVYRELTPLTAEAAPEAIESYQQAMQLWPANPRLSTELARVYILLADQQVPLTKSEDTAVAAEAQDLRQDYLDEAEYYLTKSIALNSNYVLARYYLSFVEERQGKIAEAVKGMELVRAAQPKDLGVAMQLTFLYLRQGKNELAKTELKRMIEIAPNFANAHWYLSVIYEQEKDLASAIAEVEAVLELNPGDTAVEQRLERLRAGTIAPPAEPLPEPVDEGVTGETSEGEITP